MKKLQMKYLPIAVFFLLFTFLITAANAATTATVTATVTFQNISVTVTDGTISYGTLGASTSKSTIATDLNDTQTATNNGNVAEDLTIKGNDSADWTLAGSAGSNQYVHKFCISSCATPPTNFTALTTSYQALATNVAANGTQTFDLQLTTPSSSSVYTSENVNVTILAAAH